jgi:hypothetical protein
MSNLTKRVQLLEQALGAYDDGLCHCAGPVLFEVCFDDREPEPIAPSWCKRCGREKKRFEVIFDD